MVYLAERLDLYDFLWCLLALSPNYYPYMAKGDTPYSDEEHPDAAVLVAGFEGILLSGIISFILAVPWSYVSSIDLEAVMIICTPVNMLFGLAFLLKWRESYGTRVTWLGFKSYALKRYSWIFSKTKK